MKIILNGRNLIISPALREYFFEKFSSLEKFVPHANTGKVEVRAKISKNTKRHKGGDIYSVEVNFSFPGRFIRASAVKWDVRIAIDAVRDQVQREIERYKGKKEALFYRGARSIGKYFRVSSLARFWRKGRIRDEGL